MEKRKDIVDKAIKALNKERVPAEPPESVVDATTEMMKEAQEDFGHQESQGQLRRAEVLRASGRFVRIAVAAGIVAAIVLCVIFFLELTGKTGLEIAKEVEVQPLEEVRETEAEEATIAVEGEVGSAMTDTLDNQMKQLLEMFNSGDMEGLRQMLDESEPEIQIAAAYYLGKMGDSQMVSLLQKLSSELGIEPNETIEKKGEVFTSLNVEEQVAQLKGNFKAKGILSGLVLDAETGEPIEGAEVQIDKGQIYTQRTDVNGYYLFKEVEEAGNYRVGIWSDAYVGIYGWDKMPILNLGTEVNIVQHFELKPACMLQVRVVNEESRPVENVGLIATWLGEDQGRAIGQRMYSKKTDANGLLLLGGFKPSQRPYLITALHRKEVEAQEERPKRLSGYAPGMLTVE
ncbi:MAG: carboxypeptidase regulatory-like domain-containing protein, partial [Planctomycetota bacterium]